jgi:hypothetical protein
MCNVVDPINPDDRLRGGHKLMKINIFFEKYSINIDTHTCMSTHLYEHTHTHRIPISTSERLNRLDLEIHEVGHQERIAVDGNIASH